MPASLTVTNLNNNVVWKKELNDQEYANFNDRVPNVRGKGVINGIRACLITVRTNSFQNFAKDFFLPTVVNVAQRSQAVVAKVFVYS